MVCSWCIHLDSGQSQSKSFFVAMLCHKEASIEKACFGVSLVNRVSVCSTIRYSKLVVISSIHTNVHSCHSSVNGLLVLFHELLQTSLCTVFPISCSETSNSCSHSMELTDFSDIQPLVPKILTPYGSHAYKEVEKYGFGPWFSYKISNQGLLFLTFGRNTRNISKRMNAWI